MKLYSFEPQAEARSTQIPLWHLCHSMLDCIDWEFNKILGATPQEERTDEFKKATKSRLEKRFAFMSGKTRITGRWKGIKPSDIFKLPTGYGLPYYMIEKIEYRTHKGTFKNPDDANDSFFDAICIPLPDEKLLEQVTHVNDEEITRS